MVRSHVLHCVPAAYAPWLLMPVSVFVSASAVHTHQDHDVLGWMSQFPYHMCELTPVVLVFRGLKLAC